MGLQFISCRLYLACAIPQPRSGAIAANDANWLVMMSPLRGSEYSCASIRGLAPPAKACRPCGAEQRTCPRKAWHGTRLAGSCETTLGFGEGNGSTNPGYPPIDKLRAETIATASFRPGLRCFDRFAVLKIVPTSRRGRWAWHPAWTCVQNLTTGRRIFPLGAVEPFQGKRRGRDLGTQGVALGYGVAPLRGSRAGHAALIRRLAFSCSHSRNS
jgi:hypothetical protein